MLKNITCVKKLKQTTVSSQQTTEYCKRRRRQHTTPMVTSQANDDVTVSGSLDIGAASDAADRNGVRKARTENLAR